VRGNYKSSPRWIYRIRLFCRKKEGYFAIAQWACGNYKLSPHWSYEWSKWASYAAIGIFTEFPHELWHNGQWSSSGAMAQFPVELWHDDHTVGVVYEGCGTISSGAMLRWSQICSSLRELWHNDHTLPVAGWELLHDTIHTTISAFTNEYNTFSSTSSPSAKP